MEFQILAVWVLLLVMNLVLLSGLGLGMALTWIAKQFWPEQFEEPEDNGPDPKELPDIGGGKLSLVSGVHTPGGDMALADSGHLSQVSDNEQGDQNPALVA